MKSTRRRDRRDSSASTALTPGDFASVAGSSSLCVGSSAQLMAAADVVAHDRSGRTIVLEVKSTPGGGASAQSERLRVFQLTALLDSILQEVRAQAPGIRSPAIGLEGDEAFAELVHANRRLGLLMAADRRGRVASRWIAVERDEDGDMRTSSGVLPRLNRASALRRLGSWLMGAAGTPAQR